jgi:hypothetical protein
VTLYQFSHWEDGSTSPTRTIVVTSDLTISATYIVVKHNVTYQSTPISVEATINGAPASPGTVIEVEDGATITITVPTEVEV